MHAILLQAKLNVETKNSKQKVNKNN